MDDGCSPLWGCVIFVLFVILNAIFHAFGSALSNVHESEIEKQAEEGEKNAKELLELLDYPGRFQDSAHAVSALLGIITGYIGIDVIVKRVLILLQEWFERIGISVYQYALQAVLVIVVLICTVVILLTFGYLVPKRLGNHHPEKTVFRYYGIVKFIMIVFSPVLWLIRRLSNLIVRIFGIDPHKDEDEVTEEEIISMVDEAHEQGVIQENEAEMIQNIFEFGDTVARDIMTHRKNIVALDGDLFLEDAMKIMLEESNSRYPVYHEDIDNIIGIIHLKDAMKQMTFKQMGHIAICDIPDLIRQVEFVPETRNINSVFQYMQNKKAHMVIVVDEYGQTAGLVAMEDILEEIVGNIQDEYDDEEDFIVHQFDDSILMDGLTPLEQVSEVLQVDFENDDCETLNGYLTYLLDHIPSMEDREVCAKGFSFQILKVENHIIQKVRVERITDDEEGEKLCQDIQNLQT
ncbi:MAG: hemolysin family protein [Lachnospiraceae bacterium]|nr:hemolysin family protein [Lachnospiraceae bacterium]